MTKKNNHIKSKKQIGNPKYKLQLTNIQCIITFFNVQNTNEKIRQQIRF